MSERKGQEPLAELPFVLSQVVLDSTLALLLSFARAAQIANRSVEAGLDRYIELMEAEMKKPQREKVRVE